MTEAKKKNRIRALVFGAILLLAFLIQSTDGLSLHIGSAKLPLLLPVLSVICMFEKEKAACWYGLFAGFLMDSISTVMIGYNALVLLILCTAIGYLATNLLRNTILTNLLVGFSFLFIYESLYWLFFIEFKQYIGASAAYFGSYLPSALLGTVMIIPLFLIIRLINRPLQIKEG